MFWIWRKSFGSVLVVCFCPSFKNHTTIALHTINYRFLLEFKATVLCQQVYHLASVRLRDMCAKLDISSELRRKIWTCFEYSLVHYTELMMDRHLDQLLMCAVYVMTKVG